MYWSNNANDVFEDKNIFESLKIGDVVNFNGILTRVIDRKYDFSSETLFIKFEINKRKYYDVENLNGRISHIYKPDSKGNYIKFWGIK